MESSRQGFVGHAPALLRALANRLGVAGSIGTVLFVAFISQLLITRVYCAFYSPLAKIPGPWHAHWTGLVLKLNILHGNRVNFIERMHEKYGPYVRVAHDEVVTRDPVACKDVHKVGTLWRKWSHIPDDMTQNVFSIVDPKAHNIRQRFYTKTFSQSSLRVSMQPSTVKTAQQAIDGIRRDGRENNGVVNVHEWFMLFGNDMMYLLTFGEGFGLMEQGKRHQDVITPVELHQMIAWTEFSLPIFLFGRFVLSHFSKRLRAIFRSDECLDPTEDQTVAQLRMKGEKDEGGRTIFARVIEDAKEDELLKSSGKTRLTDDEIAADALGFRLAGAEPVGVTLTYLIWCVLDRPAVQKQVEAEVKDVALTDEALERLPVLTAVILEGLRLWGGNATAMRRVENFTNEGARLGPYRIPKGTTVSTQAYSLHRNPAVWKDPLRWDHTRWLDPEQSHALSTERYQPFSYGTRMCAAYHLAMMEIRIMAALFFKEFPQAKLAPSVTEASMQMVDRFNLFPKYNSCEIIVKS